MQILYDLKPQGQAISVNPEEGTEIAVRKVTATTKCPQCGNNGGWRSGVGFEHEKRCGLCHLVWEPGEKYHLIRIIK